MNRGDSPNPFALFVAYGSPSSLNRFASKAKKQKSSLAMKPRFSSFLAMSRKLGLQMAVQNGMKQLFFPRKRRHSSAGRAADL
jgi:hypothetical protein